MCDKELTVEELDIIWQIRKALKVNEKPMLYELPGIIRDLHAENEAAMREALSLANSLYRQHYKEEAPNWEPLGTPAGVISQVDNMVAGLCETINSLRAQLAEAREECAKVAEEYFCSNGIAERAGKAIADAIRRTKGPEEKNHGMVACISVYEIG